MHQCLQQIPQCAARSRKQGLDEKRLKQVLKRGARTHSIITQVSAKFPSRVQVQNN